MRKLGKLLLTVGLIGTLAFGAIGCGSSKDNNQTQETKETESTETQDNSASGEKIKVRIGCVGENNVLTDALGIAQEKGYLDEEMEKVGYEAEVIGFAQAGPAINEAFVSNEIELAIYGDLPATLCKASGTDTTVFAVENDQQQMCILAQKDSGIQSVKDLPGHKVIVAVGTIYQEYFKNIIEDAGIDEAEIEQINTFSDANSIMQSGDADALITSTSIARFLEEQGIGTVVQTSEDTPEWTAQFFAVGQTAFLKENPEAAKALVKAAIRGKEYLLENKDECYQLFADRSNGYSKSVYEKIYAYDETFPYLDPVLDQDNTNRLKKLVEFCKEQSLITGDVDVESFIDPSYAKEAAEEYAKEK